MDGTFRVYVTMYLRETLGIQYVNLEHLVFDGKMYEFGSHRFTAYKDTFGTWRFV